MSRGITIRVAVQRPLSTRWLDAYPGESPYEFPEPVRIDALKIRARSVNRASWLRREFRNLEIEGPDVPHGPSTDGVLGNRARRGPRMRADDAMSNFGERAADNMVVLVRGRQSGAPKLNQYWAPNVERLVVYELISASNAVRIAFEVLDPVQLHRDQVQRSPLPGLDRTQETLIYTFQPRHFRRITDFDELRQGKRPLAEEGAEA